MGGGGGKEVCVCVGGRGSRKKHAVTDRLTGVPEDGLDLSWCCFQFLQRKQGARAGFSIEAEGRTVTEPSTTYSTL